MTEKLKQKARDFIKEYLRDNLILDEVALMQFTTETTKELEKENNDLEGCLLAEQEYTLMLEKENKEFKEQIEKMKCCGNCKLWKIDTGTMEVYGTSCCQSDGDFKCDKWLKE